MKVDVTFQDVKVARSRLTGHVKKTPLIQSDVINIITGKNIWFKPECTQKVGAFKYRGAFNRLSAMSETERARGVVAYSSGNHAQGVSRSAKELGMSAIIVMPKDAPKIKVEGVIRDGAEIIFYDRETESRESIAEKISKNDGRIIVPSYDDPFIIAGQGTTGLEIIEEAQQKNIEIDAVITPMGGGGLCAGTGLAVKALSPRTKMFGAEPRDYNDHQLSIRAGHRIAYQDPAPTICDAIMTPIPGELTFPINKRNVEDVFDVSDRDCLISMAIIKKELGIQVEPGGVVGFAAVLNGNFNSLNANTICVVLSGGNVDPEIALRADQMLQA